MSSRRRYRSRRRSSSSSSRSRSRSRRRYRRSRSSDYRGSSRRYIKDEHEEERLEIRSVIDAKIVGHLIGRNGSSIKRVREKSGCFIDIGDTIDGCPYVLVTTKGHIENILDALYRIGQRTWEVEIQQEREERKRLDRDKDRDREYRIKHESYLVKLLIPDGQVGAIIGKRGSVINSFRESSGCSIKLYDECLIGSTEKICELKGSPVQLERALDLVLKEISENREKANPRIPFHPVIDSRQGIPLPQMRGVPPPPMIPLPQMRGQGPIRGESSGGGAPPPMGFPPPGPFWPPPQQHQQIPHSGFGPLGTVMVPVPEHLMAIVIGKKGITIKEIRRASKAEIKVDSEITKTGERMITISGSEEAIEIAVGMVFDRMNENGV